MNLKREWPVFALLATLGAVWLVIAYAGVTYRGKFKPTYKNYSVQKDEVNILHPPPPPPNATPGPAQRP